MAKEARNNMSMVGRPSNNDYRSIIEKNIISKFPVTIKVINIAEHAAKCSIFPLISF